MQDDWYKWLPMAEFADNDAWFAGSGMTPFFANKDFYSWMSFTPVQQKASTAQEHLAAKKAEDITQTMERILDLMRSNSAKTRKSMAA